ARGPVAVCARRLFECVEEQSEAAALRVLRKLLAPGSLVLLELEVREEAPSPLGTPLHRHVEPSALARRWTTGSHFALESLEHDVADAVARVTLRKRGALERRWCERGLRLRRAAGRLRRRLSRGSLR
ncbi:MAG: hypothetical protein M3Y20_06405, partial [Actinomycetota bacterium]|nr:hypothetical protein [Actinomycetota bacterium]